MYFWEHSTIRPDSQKSGGGLSLRTNDPLTRHMVRWGTFLLNKKLCAPLFHRQTKRESVIFVHLCRYLFIENVFWMKMKEHYLQYWYFARVIEPKYSIIPTTFIFCATFSKFSWKLESLKNSVDPRLSTRLARLGPPLSSHVCNCLAI